MAAVPGVQRVVLGGDKGIVALVDIDQDRAVRMPMVGHGDRQVRAVEACAIDKWWRSG